jgi:hypothetical protein
MMPEMKQTFLDYATPARFQPLPPPQIEWPALPGWQTFCWTFAFFFVNIVVLGFTVWGFRRILDSIIG